jgi:hypothetical protein
MQNVLDTREPDQRAEVFHKDNAWATREERRVRTSVGSEYGLCNLPHAFEYLHDNLEGQFGGDRERCLIRVH